MAYDKNALLHGIGVGRALKGAVITRAGDKFWSGENLLSDSQKDINNWGRKAFDACSITYSDGLNDMVVTPNGVYECFYLPVTIQAYTTYVFTGLYRSVSGSTYYHYDVIDGERNAVTTNQPTQNTLSALSIISLSQPLYMEASEEFRRYTAFAFSETERTVYLIISFGQYLDYRSTHVQWKNLCFAEL